MRRTDNVGLRQSEPDALFGRRTFVRKARRAARLINASPLPSMNPPTKFMTIAFCATFALLLPSVAARAQAPLPTNLPLVQGAATPSGAAPEPNADTILVRNAVATLTRGEYEQELMRLSADARGGFGADPTRVNQLLNRMLVTKTMAAEARTAGIDKLPEGQRRIALETDRTLAAMYTEWIDAKAAEEFNARAGIEAAARERWIADRDKYRAPETLTVTQILFSLSKHDRDDALKLARDARARIVAGADMSALAKEISDDPAVQSNAGRIENFRRDQVDPAFAQAAFALANVGSLSEPVLTRFGYHVIRLDGRQAPSQRPFPDVKDAIIAEMRGHFVERRRAERIAEIRNDPNIVVNESAVEALVTRIDQDAIRKAVDQANAAPSAATPIPLPKPAVK